MPLELSLLVQSSLSAAERSNCKDCVRSRHVTKNKQTKTAGTGAAVAATGAKAVGAGAVQVEQQQRQRGQRWQRQEQLPQMPSLPLMLPLPPPPKWKQKLWAQEQWLQQHQQVQQQRQHEQRQEHLPVAGAAPQTDISDIKQRIAAHSPLAPNNQDPVGLDKHQDQASEYVCIHASGQ